MSPGARRAFGVLLAIGVAFPHAAAALTACTAADVIAQDPGCPAGDGPCEVTKSFQTDTESECTLDFGGRSLTVSGQIAGHLLRLEAGSVTVNPGGLIRALPHIGAEFGYGGSVEIAVTGNVRVRRQPPFSNGRIDVSAPSYGLGHVQILAGGDVTVEGQMLAAGSGRSASAGWIEIYADGAIRTMAGSLIAADGGTGGTGAPPGKSGYVDLVGERRVEIAGRVTLHGETPEGGFDAQGDDVVITGDVSVDGYHRQTSAAGIDVHARHSLRLSGELSAEGGPSNLGDDYGGGSGGVVLESDGDLFIDDGARIITDGPLYGCAGKIELIARNRVDVAPAAILSASHRSVTDWCSQEVYIEGSVVTLSGTLRLRNGIFLTMYADSLSLLGPIDGVTTVSDAEYAEYSEAEVLLVAGNAERSCSEGTLVVGGDLDLSASGCDAGICPPTRHVRLQGCDVRITPNGSIRGRAPEGAEVVIDACRSLRMEGSVDVAGTAVDGTVSVRSCHSPRGECLLPGSIDPPPRLRFGACGSCPGDCDGDGSFTPADTAILLGRLNRCQGRAGPAPRCWLPPCRNADLDDSGTITAAELVRVTERQRTGGACPR